MENKLKIKSEIKRLKERGYPIDTFEGSAGYYDALDEVLNFIDSLPEEPVSEELIIELKSIVNIRELAHQGIPVIKIARHIANWQKEKDQETIELAEDHAILAGMNKMKEEMMKDAVDATVHIDAGGYPYIPQMELYDYDKDVPLAKEGDKYKVVLIKED